MLAEGVTTWLEQRLEKRILPTRFKLLKCLLESSASKDCGLQVRAKSVRALGEVVKADSRLLSMQQVARCLRTALHVSNHALLLLHILENVRSLAY